MNILYLFLFSLTCFRTFTARLLKWLNSHFSNQDTKNTYCITEGRVKKFWVLYSELLSLVAHCSLMLKEKRIFLLTTCINLISHINKPPQFLPSLQTSLNAHKTHHHLLPFFHIWIYANSIVIADDSISGLLPEDLDQSWLNTCAFFVARWEA